MNSRQLFRGKLDHAFTLVELLVVTAIIGLLVGILLPAIQGARQQAALTDCAARVKQLATALINYSADNHGLFPPNNKYDPSFGMTMNWNDVDRIRRYVPGTPSSPAMGGFSPLTGPLWICRSDDRSLRSYAMNIWVSCDFDDTSVISSPIPQGAKWRGSGSRMDSTVILVTERWSTSGTAAAGYYAPPTVGTLGSKPGLRFGVLSGVTISNTHWKPNPISELPYQWHRRRGDGGNATQSYGRVNIGYIDGHVATKTVTDLANRATGLSTMDSVWSPLDRQLNN